jgi:hypothetical protein
LRGDGGRHGSRNGWGAGWDYGCHGGGDRSGIGLHRGNGRNGARNSSGGARRENCGGRSNGGGLTRISGGQLRCFGNECLGIFPGTEGLCQLSGEVCGIAGTIAGGDLLGLGRLSGQILRVDRKRCYQQSEEGDDRFHLVSIRNRRSNVYCRVGLCIKKENHVSIRLELLEIRDLALSRWRQTFIQTKHGE